jgi:acetyl-CoA acetyltransferase family protein
MKDAFVIDAARTPRAKKKGKFASVHPVDLFTYPLNAIAERNEVPPAEVNDVLVGIVTQTGEQGWCAGRSGVLAAGWPYTVPATTINRLCGSGQQAVNFAALGIQAGHYDLVVGGGVEHMTRVPMFSDMGGEESPLLHRHYPDLVQQGKAAEILSREFKIDRKSADDFACGSQQRAQRALTQGHFKRSMAAVPYTDEHGAAQRLDADDNVRPSTTVEGLGQLKPAFEDNGVITAGNASAIVDGAAAVLLASDAKARALELTPRARIAAIAEVGSAPKIMLTGPITAVERALRTAGLKVSDIDLWEINEAFAPVPLVLIRHFELDPDKVNVNGGAIALGHPLGATGAMLIGTALDELERTGKRYAMITMCIGLGMGIATIIERI